MTCEELRAYQACTNLLQDLSDVVYRLEYYQLEQWAETSSVLCLQVNDSMIEEFRHEH